MAAAGGFTVHAVIPAHDALDAGFLHAAAERREVGFCQILLADLRVKRMSPLLRAGVSRKMLDTGCGLQPLAVALNAFYIGRAHAARQVGILAVGFVAAAPARVAENIDVGCPECQPLVQAAVILFPGGVVLGAALGGRNIANFLH